MSINQKLDLLFQLDKYRSYKIDEKLAKTLDRAIKITVFYTYLGNNNLHGDFLDYFKETYNLKGKVQISTISKLKSRFVDLIVDYQNTFYVSYEDGRGYYDIYQADSKKFDDFCRRWEIIPPVVLSYVYIWNQRFVRDNTTKPKYMSDYALSNYVGFHLLNSLKTADINYTLYKNFIKNRIASDLLFIPFPNKAKYFARKSKNPEEDGVKSYLIEEVTDLIENHDAIALGSSQSNYIFTLKGMTKINEDRIEKHIDGNIAIDVKSVGGFRGGKLEYELVDDPDVKSQFQGLLTGEKGYGLLRIMKNMPWGMTEEKYQQYRREVFDATDIRKRIEDFEKVGELIEQKKEEYENLTQRQKVLIREFYYEMFFLGMLIHGWNINVKVLYNTTFEDLDQKAEEVSQIVARWREFFVSSGETTQQVGPDRNAVKDFIDSCISGSIGRDGSRLMNEKVTETIFNIDCLHRLSYIFTGTGYVNIKYILTDNVMLTRDGLFTVDTKGNSINDRQPEEEFSDYKLGEYYENDVVIQHYYRVLYDAFRGETAAVGEGEGGNLVAGAGGILIQQNEDISEASEQSSRGSSFDDSE